MASRPRSARVLFGLCALFAFAGTAWSLTANNEPAGAVGCSFNGTIVEITLSAGESVTIAQAGAGADITIGGSNTCGGTPMTTGAGTGAVDAISITGQPDASESVTFDMSGLAANTWFGPGNDTETTTAEIEVYVNLDTGTNDTVTFTGGAVINRLAFGRSTGSVDLGSGNSDADADMQLGTSLTNRPDRVLMDLAAGADVVRANGGGGTLAADTDTVTAPNLPASATNSTIPVTINAGAGADDIVGSNAGDIIDGGDDNDLILWGQGGDDIIKGGNGNDTITPDDGDDFIVGGCGNDTLLASNGNDVYYEGDTCNGQNHNGSDSIAVTGTDTGTGTNDTVIYYTAAGDPTTARTTAALSLDADNVNDDGVAGEADNIDDSIENFIGGIGDDTIVASAGTNGTSGPVASGNVMTGGPGADALNAGTSGADVLNYGPVVTLDGWLASPTGGHATVYPGNDGGTGITVDLTAQTVSGGSGVDTLTNTFEHVFGSDFDDTLTGTTGNDSIHGRGGNDTIDGGDGSDTTTLRDLSVAGWQSSGTATFTTHALTGGSGNDTIRGGLGGDTIAGDGNGVAESAGGVDTIYGSTGPGVTGDTDGNDTIAGGGGNDIIEGHDGDDTISGGLGDDSIVSGLGNDTIIGGTSALATGDLDATVGGTQADGNDVIDAGDGDDVIWGNDGNDSITDGAGRDVVKGGAGDDTFEQGSTPNGADSLAGGPGTDSADYEDRTAAWNVLREGNAQIAGEGNAGRCVNGTNHSCEGPAQTEWNNANANGVEVGNDGDTGTSEGDDVWSDVELPAAVTTITASDPDNTGLGADGRDINITWTIQPQATGTINDLWVYAFPNTETFDETLMDPLYGGNPDPDQTAYPANGNKRVLYDSSGNRFDQGVAKTMTVIVQATKTYPNNGNPFTVALASGSASFLMTPEAGVVGPPDHLEWVVNPVNDTPNGTLGDSNDLPLEVMVVDSGGNPVTTDPDINVTEQISVAFTAGSNAEGAVLAGTLTKNVTWAQSGITLDDAAVNLVGTYQLTASAVLFNPAGGATANSSVFSITAGAPASLFFVTQPPNGAPDEPLDPVVCVGVRDSSGTQVTTDPDGGATEQVTLSIKGGTGTGGAVLSGLGPVAIDWTTTDTACFPAAAVDLPGDAYELIATDSNFTPAITDADSDPFDIGGSQLAWTVQPPTTAVAGSTWSATVQVRDTSDNPVVVDPDGDGQNDETVTLTIFSQAQPATPVGVLTASPDAIDWSTGNAVFTGNLSIDRVGTYVLTATATGAWTSTLPTPANSTEIDITHAAADHLAWATGADFHSNGASFVAGNSISPVKVRVEDAFGNLVTTGADASTEITLALDTNATGATITGTGPVVENAVAGIADFSSPLNQLLVTKVGTYDWEASDTDGAGQSVDPVTNSNDFVITHAAAAHLAWGPTGGATFHTDGQGFVAGEAIFPMTVRVEDQFDNLVTTGNDADTQVTLSLGLGAGAVGLAGDLVESASAGVATFAEARGIVVEKIGTYDWVATDTDAADIDLGNVTDSNNFVITHAAADHLAWGSQYANGQEFAAGATITPLTVRVEDEFANLVSTGDDADTQVTLSLETNPGSATPAGTLVETATGGVVDFGTGNGINVTTVALAYDWQAVDSDGSGGANGADLGTLPDSNDFDIVGGAPHHLAWLEQPTDTVAGQEIDNDPDAVGDINLAGPELRVQVQDQYGNAASEPDSGLDPDFDETITLTLVPDAGAANIMNGTPGDYDGPFVSFVTVAVDWSDASTVDVANLHIEIAAIDYRFDATYDADGGPALHVDFDDPLASADFDILQAAPAALYFVGQPPDGETDEPLDPAVCVGALDAFDNPIVVDPTAGTEQVALSKDGGPGIIVVTSPVSITWTGTAATSCASFPDVAGNVEGDYTLDATDGGFTSLDLTDATSETFTLADAQLFWTDNPPATAIAGEAWGATVQVQHGDGSAFVGDPDADGGADETITVAIFSKNPVSPAGTLTGTREVSVTWVNGNAVFTGLSLDKVGTYILVANPTSEAGDWVNEIPAAANSTEIVITHAAADHLAWATAADFHTDGQSFVAGASITPMKVRVEDEFGNLVTGGVDANTGITLSLGRNDTTDDLDNATIAAGTVTEAAVAGIADFSSPGNGIQVTKTGTYDWVATDSDAADANLGNVTDSPDFVVTHAAAHHLAWGSQFANGQDFAPGVDITPVKVRIEDQFNNLVTTGAGATASVVIALDGNPTSATLNGTKTDTAAAGVAEFDVNGVNDLNVTVLGTAYDLHATSAGLAATPDGNDFDIVAKLVFVEQPPDDSPYDPFDPIDEDNGDACFTIEVQDSNGNVLTTYPATLLTLRFVNNATGTATAFDNTATTVNGVATFCNLNIDEPGDDYTFEGDDGAGGLDPTPESNTIDITAPPPANNPPTVSIVLEVQEPGESTWTPITNASPVTNSTPKPKTNALLRARIITSNDLDGDPMTYTYQWWVNGIVRRTPAPTTNLTDVYDISAEGEADVANIVTVSVRAHDTFEYGPSAEAGVQVANTAPTALNRAATVASGVDRSIRLKGRDDDDMQLKFRITELPENGTLEFDGTEITEDDLIFDLADFGAIVTYNASIASGTDSFAFQAGDTQGSATAWSANTATVSVQIGTTNEPMTPPAVDSDAGTDTVTSEPTSGTTPDPGAPVKTSVVATAPTGEVTGFEIVVASAPDDSGIVAPVTHDLLPVQQDVIVREVGSLLEVNPTNFALAAQPLQLTFVIDDSVIPALSPASADTDMLEAIIVYRDSVAIAGCPAAGACVDSITRNGDGDVELVVNADHASSWNFAAPLARTTSVLSGPEGATNANAPNNVPAPIIGNQVPFTFTSAPLSNSFECSLRRGGDTIAVTPLAGDAEDCGAVVAGIGSRTYSVAGLPDDVYTFRVQSDDGGNIARRDFVVDRTAPAVSITTGPANNGTITTSSATFTFTSNEPGSAFDCQLDLSTFVPCSSKTITYNSIANGTHIFTVRATDTVGNASTSPRTFTVSKASTDDPTPPTTIRPRTGTPIRVAGRDRTETAELVSRIAFPEAEVVYIATQWDYADALSAGPGAVSEEAPVLLTAIHSLDDNTANELARLRPRRIVVMGGHAAVDESVFEQLAPFASEEIVRVAGVDRFGTAAALSKDKFPNGANTVYLATGRSYPDALAGGLAASAEDAPVLLTEPNVLPQVTAEELLRLRADRIVIIGGTGTVARGLEALLADYAPVVERVSGADRYETTANVNNSVVSGTDTVFIVTGKTFGDALTGIPIAALSQSAVLMVGDGPLHPSVIAELDRLQPRTVIVLGGSAAVAERVELQLAEHMGEGTGDGERGLQVDQDDVDAAMTSMRAAESERAAR